MMREEHLDFFGNASSGSYTHKSSKVTNTAVTSNILTIDGSIPIWRAFASVVDAFTVGDSTPATKGTLELDGANALSSGALSNAVTLWSKEIAKTSLTAGAEIMNILIPHGYKYVQLKFTPESSKAFTDGTLDGRIEPEFN